MIVAARARALLVVLASIRPLLTSQLMLQLFRAEAPHYMTEGSSRTLWLPVSASWGDFLIFIVLVGSLQVGIGQLILLNY